MTIQNFYGDVLKSNSPLIVHQVNCLGIMGGGIALTIKKRFPIVFKEYSTLCLSQKKKSDLLGQIQIVNVGDFSIVNLFGQNSINGIKDTDYTAFEHGLTLLNQYMKENKISEVAFPYKIGCGLGGGDWNVISELIETRLDDTFLIKIYKLE